MNAPVFLRLQARRMHRFTPKLFGSSHLHPGPQLTLKTLELWLDVLATLTRGHDSDRGRASTGSVQRVGSIVGRIALREKRTIEITILPRHLFAREQSTHGKNALGLNGSHQCADIRASRTGTNGRETRGVIAAQRFEFGSKISCAAFGFTSFGCGCWRGSNRSQLVMPASTGSRSSRQTVSAPFFARRVQPALHRVQNSAAKLSGDFQRR